MTDNVAHPFWPQEIGPYEADLRVFLTLLNGIKNRSEIISLIEKQTKKLSSYPNTEGARLRYRSYLLVLLDLIRQQWEPEYRQGNLYLRPPIWAQQLVRDESGQDYKEVIRQSLSWERRAQFQKSSVCEFIRYMEKRRPFNNEMVSIRSLLADGETLAKELQEIATIDNEVEQKQCVGSIIQPYLQLITDNSRCAHTGLRLLDIWRYLRYKWATPYNSTPGRQVFYLVRDAKRPFHPVIGIAALGNSMVQLTVRDDVIGWTSEAFQARLEANDFDDVKAQTVSHMLYQTLVDSLNDIETNDLITEQEANCPTVAVIERLERIEEENRTLRITLLQQQRDFNWLLNVSPNQIPLSPFGEPAPNGVASHDELAEQVQRALFRAKRANVLRSLLLAKQVLENTDYSIKTKEGLKALWATSDGQRGIKTLIKENKKRKVGINMMDIIICGAIPPYNTLLGGKLVAMLLTSPQIVQDYKQKYMGYISNIASKMKGANVQREPKLVFLGTTSLYSSGSSQYNRISIPVPQNKNEQIRYIKYGLTKGYGSIHFSKETRESLNELQEYTHGARLINNRFGEGVNPKLRRVSAGLASIGLIAVDKFIKHHSQRIVYGIPLGCAAYAYLRGEADNPGYFFDVDSSEKIKESIMYISRYWAERWLLNRIQKPEVLAEISSFNAENFLLSAELSNFESEERIEQKAMSI